MWRLQNRDIGRVNSEEFVARFDVKQRYEDSMLAHDRPISTRRQFERILALVVRFANRWQRTCNPR